MHVIATLIFFHLAFDLIFLFRLFNKNRECFSAKVMDKLFSEAMFQEMLLPSSGPKMIEVTIETYLY